MKMVTQHIRECPVCSQEEKRLREINAALKVHAAVLAEVPGAGICPDADLLIAYAGHDNTLSAQERMRIKQHLSACPACRKECDALTGLDAFLQSEPAKPADLYTEESFLRMVAGRIPLRSIVRRRFGMRATGVLKNAAERLTAYVRSWFIIQPQPVLVRSARSLFQENITVIQDTSGDMEFMIEIESLDEHTAELAVFLGAPPAGLTLAGMRLSLFQEEAELVSRFVEHDTVIFSNVMHGTYTLIVSAGEQRIKEVRFDTR
ncbi:MAG: hypothetical protein GY868_01315 [Deltaproteobacteria bacterium]|nr:hypothetical protein [Deltaproteobacteria bacterium]